MKNYFSALLIILFLLIAFYFTYSGEDNVNESSSTGQFSYKNINSEELKSYFDEGRDIFLLDVHIPEQTHLEGTDEFIPFNEIKDNKAKLPEDKNTEIIVYCRSGNMSETASETLIELGYKNVKNLVGGVNAWRANGYE